MTMMAIPAAISEQHFTGTLLSQNTAVPDGLVVLTGDNADGLGPIEAYGEGLMILHGSGSLLPSNSSIPINLAV